MTKRTAALTSVILLVLGIAAFTGSALAGNGNANGKADTQADVHGNSANAAGQVKQDSLSTQASGGGSADQNAGAQAGAKPTSATAKGNKPTSCTTGGGTGSSATCTSNGSTAATAQTAAKPDSSKRYGNGTTAAQTANSHGAPAGTQVYGPGNSQPHKVVDCKRNHWVDVHAVKSYATAPCSTLTGTTNGTIAASVPGSTNGPSIATATSSNASSSTRGHGTAGGVLGVTASGGTGPAGGVLGAIASVGSGVLPFTGISLWLVMLAAAGLIVLGLLVRRGGRALV